MEPLRFMNAVATINALYNLHSMRVCRGGNEFYNYRTALMQ